MDFLIGSKTPIPQHQHMNAGIGRGLATDGDI
jgi:hypothetical protein